jgi:hypothetical protein
MCSRSFPSCARLVPHARGGKPWLLFAAVILAGCGGAGGTTFQEVDGAAYTFEAPSEWTISRTPTSTAASTDAGDRVEVRTFTLVKPYRHELLAGAAHELDRVAEKLATRLHGRVVSRATRAVRDLDARAYTIRYGDRAYEITFVLDGGREYELLCRRRAEGDREPCVRLVESFSLG